MKGCIKMIKKRVQESLLGKKNIYFKHSGQMDDIMKEIGRMVNRTGLEFLEMKMGWNRKLGGTMDS